MKRKLAILGAILLAAFIFTYEGNTYQAHALDEEDLEWIAEAGQALRQIVEDREVMALVYLCDEYELCSDASEDSAAVVTVPSGQMVEILDVTVDEDGQVWEKVSTDMSGTDYIGYVRRDYLACSDERFLEWEEYYGMNPGGAAMLAADGRGNYADIEQFPAGYQPALTALKEKYPNWIFVRYNTELDWNTVITNELQGNRSQVSASSPDWAKGDYYGAGWYNASRQALEAYMDPRNALREGAIFQFEQLTYNESYHTEEAMKTFLEDTFMNSSANAPGTNMKFYYIFYAIGKEDCRRISPFHLAARVLQEQGKGTSPIISGTVAGYEGYYNYFNVGASGSTTQEIIHNGLEYAKIMSGKVLISPYWGEQICWSTTISVMDRILYICKSIMSVKTALTDCISTSICRISPHLLPRRQRCLSCTGPRVCWINPLYLKFRSMKICRENRILLRCRRRHRP